MREDQSPLKEIINFKIYIFITPMYKLYSINQLFTSRILNKEIIHMEHNILKSKKIADFLTLPKQHFSET